MKKCIFACPPTSVSLGGFPILYNVEVKLRIEDWTDDILLRVNTTDLSYDLTGLEPLTRYDARVRSLNINGFSEFSEVKDFSTFGMCMHLYVCVYSLCKYNILEVWNCR